MVWCFWECLWCQRSRSAPPLKFLQDLGLLKKSDGDQEEAKMPWFTLHPWESHFQISSVSVARGTLFLPLPQVSLELTAYRGRCWLQDGLPGQEHPNCISCGDSNWSPSSNGTMDPSILPGLLHSHPCCPGREKAAGTGGAHLWGSLWQATSASSISPTPMRGDLVERCPSCLCEAQ